MCVNVAQASLVVLSDKRDTPCYLPEESWRSVRLSAGPAVPVSVVFTKTYVLYVSFNWFFDDIGRDPAAARDGGVT